MALTLVAKFRLGYKALCPVGLVWQGPIMPRVGIHAIIVNEDNHVLLVRRNYLEHDWIPPGGMMEDGESIPSAVAREVLEETCYVIEPTELVAVGSRPRTNDVIIVMAAKIVEKANGQIDPNEIAEIGFFSFDKLPEPMNPEAKKLLALFRDGIRGHLLIV
ncbi:MAG: NUDIX domain-containing protein [Bdellovibrionaceae bacterium]|nr:NUDIX domain-containing protein [Pseudobdellovibrionaceae bacterium]